MFLMIATRPDLAYSVNVLSRFSFNPGPSHWHAMMHVLGYLKGSLDYSITYHQGASLTPIGFVNADFAGCLDTRRSTSGELYAMAGGLVAWGAHRERTVTLSTAEEEYMAGAHGARQLRWMYSFLDEVKLPQPLPAQLFGDNLSAIQLSKSTRGHARTKHIDIRHHYLREQVEDGELTLTHVPS
jgi:hypothetical protein